MPAMTPEQVAKALELFAKDAIAWSDSQSDDRTKAMEYYDGIMADTPSDEGRSSVVSKDFRAATKKVLPSITRTIFGSDKVVEYQGIGEGDEEMAEQANDYINYVVMPECHGEEHIRDAIHDALRLRNGILKWWWDKTIDVKVTKHTGQTIEDLAHIAAEDEVEILEQSQDENGFNVKLRRRITKGEVRIAAIPLEEFFISPDALDISEAVFVAHNQQLKRYQLVAMGYDRERIRNAKAYTAKTSNSDSEKQTRRDDETLHNATETIKDMEEVDYWECFVRLDEDDDGIAELRRIVMIGGWSAKDLFEDEECDEAPFTDVVIERRPHEWQGRSLFDDVREIQRVKTVLKRSVLDNIYWQNNLQPVINDAAVSNMDAVMNPKFGQPIRIKAGFNVNDAVQFAQVPFVAKQAFEMLAYFDDVLADLTGIRDESGGLPADAIQNVTAKASALMEQQGISQVELMVRNVAVGLRRLFKGVLKLVIQHQDKPRMIKLRDNPVTFNPRSWDANMDASVNIGLGAGTRERDMVAMQMVVQAQEKVLLGLGPDNPLVKPDQVYNGLAKLAQAAGIKNVSAYFTKPDPAEVQAKMQAAANKPDPEMMKVEAQKEIEAAKLQAQTALEQQRLQADTQRMAVEAEKSAMTEQAQMEADLQVKAADRENQIVLKQMDHMLEREKLAQQREIEMMKINAQAQAQREQREHQERVSAAQMHNDNVNADADRKAASEAKSDG